MDKEKAIREVIDASIKNFANGFELRYEADLDNPDGVINSKKKNIFVAELGEEFMFYSAFVRSFDSSFGKVIENIGKSIAKLSYDVRGDINSFLLPQQEQHVTYLMSAYDTHSNKPDVEDYYNFTCVIPKDLTSYKKRHVTDNNFYNPIKKEHYIIELKLGSDLDNKKSKAEKIELLHEFFLLKNSISNSDEKVRIFLAAAYNKDGEGNEWIQDRVRQYFAEEELLIGKDYWNFVCDLDNGFDIVFDQYKKSCQYIKNSLEKIKKLYVN